MAKKRKQEGMASSGRMAPPWLRQEGVFEAPPLAGTIEADVCVVGAGFAGLTAAYRLASEGKSVVVIEDGALASGESGRTTAHLSTALGHGYLDLERMHGESGARLIYESHASAIDFIERACSEERIDCGFSRLNGYLFLAADQPLSMLDKELAACERAGVAGIRKEQQAPLEFWDSGPCLMFPGQAQVDPVLYLSGLARAAQRKGAKIYMRSHATLFREEPLRVRAASGAVIARSVILATNAPIDDRLAISTRQAAYRTYAIAARLSRGAMPKMLLWDTLDPYHYVRIQEQEAAARGRGDLLIVGGEDHKVAHAFDAKERWDRLEAWMRARFPMAGEVSHRWSGQIQEAADGIGFVGRHPAEAQEIYIVTGDCGNGTTNGTLGGILLADRILGRRNDWAPIYEPSRLPMAPYALAAENLDAAAQYLRYAGAGEASSVDEIPPGCGGVLRRGFSPVAVYRDAQGSLHERSAVCPHLGGVVCWNPGEGTWDCPVHGSRFDPEGRVITGPANEGLGATPGPPPPGPSTTSRPIWER